MAQKEEVHFGNQAHIAMSYEPGQMPQEATQEDFSALVRQISIDKL